MISLTSDMVGELLPWTDKTAPPRTDFSRCFEGGEEGHEELAHPESDLALGKDGPQLEAEGAVVTSTSTGTGAHTMHFDAQMSVWFRRAWGLRVSTASGYLAPLPCISGSLLGTQDLNLSYIWSISTSH